jgi:hypothetical protein
MRRLFITCFTFLSFLGSSQISFVLTPSLCAGDSVNVLANTNTFPANSFTWSVSPAGAIISSATSQATYITSTNSGVYSILIAGTVGNVTSFATHTILVQPKPQLLISSSNATICSGQSATLIASCADSYTWVPTPGFVVAYGGTAFVAPGLTEIYTVSGSNSAGCVSSFSYTLHFGIFPILNVVPSSTKVCSGYNATLSATGASSYSWTSSNFTGTLYQASLSAAPGTFSVIGSNGGSCRDSTVITIAMSPPLNLVINADRAIICKDGGDTLVLISLSAQGANYYTWEPYNSANMTFSVGPMTTVSPTISTCYTLTGSTSVCSAKVISCIEVRYCLGMKEPLSRNTIFMFPNPLHDQLYIQSEFPDILTFELADIFGNTLLKKELDTTKSLTQSISVNELSSGFYLAIIRRNNVMISMERIMKD